MAFLMGILCGLMLILPVSSQTTILNEMIQKEINTAAAEEEFTMESEVLGPLRVWHLVFLVSAFILVIITIVCCCCDFRIPRTRQEIEEGYKKRVDNASYIKYLDNLPTNVLKHKPPGRLKQAVTEDETEVTSQRPARATEADGPKTKLTKGGQVAVATPLASHPGVMEAMTRMKGNARSRPRPGMAKAMTSLPKPDRNHDT